MRPPTGLFDSPGERDDDLAAHPPPQPVDPDQARTVSLLAAKHARSLEDLRDLLTMLGVLETPAPDPRCPRGHRLRRQPIGGSAYHMFCHTCRERIGP